MATRTVTSQLLLANGAPWVGADVRFTLVEDTFTLIPPASYPNNTVIATTDTNGNLTVELAAGLSVQHRVKLPSGETFTIVVEEGAPTTLEALRAATEGATAPLVSLESIITDLIAGGVGMVSVQESDDPRVAALAVLDFLGDHFNVTESPSGEANIALATVPQPSNSILTLLAALADPGADRILFWDESAGSGGALAWLLLGTGLSIVGTTISAVQIPQTEAIVTLIDDFMFSGTASGDVGELGWTLGGGGSVSILAPPGTTGQGWIELASTGVSGNFTRITSSSDSVRFTHDYDVTINMRSVDIAGNSSQRFGLADAVSGQPAAGIYFERLAADTNWFLVTRFGGVETRTDTGLAHAITTINKFRLRKLGSSVFWSVNGGAESAAITSNVPISGTGMFFFQVSTSTGTARRIGIDYFRAVCSTFAR